MVDPLSAIYLLLSTIYLRAGIREMKKSRCRGFTLVEGLAVVLVMAIGMAISVPMFVSAMKDAKSKQCRANMQAIANAEEQYKIKSSTHTYTTQLSNLVG